MDRASGVLMHVSSLWGKYSVGSFGKAAYDWVDYLADCGFSYWQVLPFCLPDEYNSPYKSFSAFSGNPYFIDLPELYDEGLITKDELDAAVQLSPYSCEFSRLSRERMVLLGKAAERFLKDSKNRSKIRAFSEQYPETAEFCRFMGLRRANKDVSWQEWEITAPDAKTENTWLFTQYTFHAQWKRLKDYANSRGIRIIGDIPIYVAYESADVWAHPEQYLLDSEGRPECVAGVPPDYFCPDGQLWGNPLYNWDYMKKDGFSWWRKRIAFSASMFDGLRIDHFRGIESYFSIPASDDTAKNGVWMKGPGMDLVKAIKESAGDCLIIAEDLGDITPEVRELVDESGFPGMRVFQFGFLGDKNSPHLPHNYINNCVAYTGTHDNNTLLGYVWDQDDETRKRLLSYCGYFSSDWDAGYNSILRTMFASSAGIVILPVQDLLLFGCDTRLNKPGTSDDNWNYRITKEQLERVDRNKFRSWNDWYAR